MAFDSIVRKATLPDGRKGQDVAIAGGRIVAVEPGIEAEAAETIDARGYLLAPPFVDCHFHLDATLSLGLPRLNVSGTLLEGIALWGELKPHLTHEAVAERALKYCDLAVSQGLLAIRSHVDVCDDRLRRCRSVAGREKEGEALSRSPAGRLSPGRLFPVPKRRPQSRARARSRRRCRRRDPAFRAHDGGRRGFRARLVRDRVRGAG